MAPTHIVPPPAPGNGVEYLEPHSTIVAATYRDRPGRPGQAPVTSGSRRPHDKERTESTGTARTVHRVARTVHQVAGTVHRFEEQSPPEDQTVAPIFR